MLEEVVMAANPKISIDKTEAQFLSDESSYLESVASQEIITPESQNVEAGLLRTLQGRLAKAFINVFEFGVVGSGDDTTAMQAAFTAGGTAVYFIPPGTYSFTTDINAAIGSLVFLVGVTLTGGNIIGTDITLIGPSASGAGTPIGSVVPTHIGQEYFQTTPATWYKSSGLTNADWLAIS